MLETLEKLARRLTIALLVSLVLVSIVWAIIAVEAVLTVIFNLLGFFTLA